MTFDRAEFLTGDEAVEAAGEPPPNDYFVVNDDRATEELSLAHDVRVAVVRCPDSCREGFRGTVADVASRRDRSQYWLTVRDGEVVEIHEQYVP